MGRHFVQFLLENELVSHVRVADKVPPVTAWLNDHQKVVIFYCQCVLIGAFSDKHNTIASIDFT